MRISFLVSLFVMLVTIFAVAVWPEKYDLIAERDVVVRKAMNQESSFEEALYVLKPGERLAVSGCVDSKSDVAVRVIAPSGVVGYVGVGDFRLKRIARSIRDFFLIFDERMVWSCRYFYENRKID